MKLNANVILTRGKWAEERLQKLLPTAPSNIVSDIGYGFAWMRDPVESLGGRWQGFDQILKAPGVLSWDLDGPAPGECPRPGVILLMEVLEHLSNPQIALHNIAEHLLPGGYMVMTSPNPAWSRSRVYALNHGVPYSFTPRHIREHHVFTTWPHIVEFMLRSSGFKVLEYVTISGGLSRGASSYPIDRAKTLAIAVLCRLIELADPTSRGYTLGMVARKPQGPETRQAA